MKQLIPIILLLISFSVNAQKPDANAILAEGKMLYKLEKASWHSTDHFLSQLENRVKEAGGYLSYESSDGYTYSIFYTQAAPVKALVRYKYEGVPSETPLLVDTSSSELTEQEAELIVLRQVAMERIYANTDSFFTFYNNTSINPIPIIKGKARKVYVLTAPQESGVVLIGNDYLLEYNAKNELVKKHKFHNTLIELPTTTDEGQEIKATVHSHVNSNHIDATDICTLLLYKDYISWKQHYVIHEDYVSIFDMEKEALVIMTSKDFERIGR